MASKLTDFLKGMFAGGGGGDEPLGDPVEYNGYTIRAAPRREGSRWLTAGVVEKAFDDGVKEHHFVRAETHGDRDEAASFAILRGKQIVDDLGDGMFKDG